MLASCCDDALLQGIFSDLQLSTTVRLGAVCSELRQAVRRLRTLCVPCDGAGRLSMIALLAFGDLEELSLDGFRMDDTVAQQLVAGMRKLRRFKASKAEVSGLEVFFAAPSLQQLSLPNSSSLYRDCSPSVSTWPSLTSLDITRTVVTDVQLTTLLDRLIGLEVLLARDCKNLQSIGLPIEGLANGVPSLRILDFSGTAIQDRTVAHLVSSLPSLRELWLRKCNRLRSPKIEHSQLLMLVLGRCDSLEAPCILTPKLESLLLFQTDVEAEVIMKVISACWSSLRYLDLRECSAPLGKCHPPSDLALECLLVSRSSVSSMFVETLIACSPRLEILDAADMQTKFQLVLPSACRGREREFVLGDEETLWLQNFVLQCPALQGLSLRFCSEIRCPPRASNLRFLELSSTSLDNEGLAEVSSKCLSLRSLLARDCLKLIAGRIVLEKLRFASFAKCRNLELLEVNASQLISLDLGECGALHTLTTDGCYNLREVNLYNPPDAVLSNNQWSHQAELNRAKLRVDLEARRIAVAMGASLYLANKPTMHTEWIDCTH